MRTLPFLHHFGVAITAFAIVTTTVACGNKSQTSAAAEHNHTDSPAQDSIKDDTKFPPAAEHALDRLRASSRHGEYVMIPISKKDSIRAWVVFPERNTPAPVVVVAHEIYGLTTWIRSVADQLAAEGFLAIAPDLVSLQKVPGSPDSAADHDGYVKAVSALRDTDIQKYLTATIKYASSLSAATKKVGIVGFCRGGGMAFMYAGVTPSLNAAVVYYGTSPAPQALDSIKAPVLGLYAGNDARVNGTIPLADSTMKALRKTFEHFTYDGAGHGFLRQQGGADGANLEATKQAWPATIAWFRRYLEG